MNTVVLDTEILSAIMRQDATALSHAQAYLAVHPKLITSIMTRFESLRGLMAKNATSQITRCDATMPWRCDEVRGVLWTLQMLKLRALGRSV